MEITCPACKSAQREPVDFCTRCRYPFLGTDAERARHIGRIIEQKGVLVDVAVALKRSRYILFGIAGFTVLALVIGLLAGTADLLGAGITLMLALVFFICGLFMERQPVLCTAIPLMFYLGNMGVAYMTDPALIFRGIVLKLAIIGMLGYGIYLVLKAQQVRNRLGAD
ncbi:hypothetical protein OZ410_13955 [Robiginitalea sp. M366]|uniref:hypothetical protein n=1 Tax=Robiginitalea aestuariiviva TaxID=3036903 RepID=UPI00240CFFCF|nr:hypothetical protein [Robiginitalea aestuariiviva]MDG1573429.1 hypothetical protein [Robiginitalea aestuariiviva]